MPFEKVETQAVDFPALERSVLAFWASTGAFAERKRLNAGKPKWSFLDGPITANNPMGVHHAWNRTYKDAFNRFFSMCGRELRYQQGFDCQGLWVEVEVEKDLKSKGHKLDSKRDIENLVSGDKPASIAAFVQACKDRVNHFARVQTTQSIRLGYWMDWDETDSDWAKSPDERKSYFTMSEANNFTIWRFLKTCHERNWVYRGYDVMPWCGRCGVGISEQEMKEGYRLVEHRAAFVKLPLIDKPSENLLVWTTTPWTLTSNVGAAVNPKLTYLQVKLKGEIYYLAKGVFKQNRMESSEGEPEASATGGVGKISKRDWLDGVPHLSSIEQMFKSKCAKGETYEIVGEVTGASMLGWKYRGPFDDLPAQQHEFGFPEEVAKITQTQGWCKAITAAAAHRVVDGGDDVTETDGTGIVHTAPGCGQIDYTWGKTHGLPPIAPIDDAGVFVEGFGPLTGKNAADSATADIVFDLLKANDRLFATERYVHRYPHCWRCKTELLYRLVDEWFINMGPRLSEEGFRGEIMAVSDKVTFLPESVNGRAREKDWLRNMGDWMISKKRYWGLALPIWVDEKDPTQFEVIGSRAELEARTIEGWPEFDGHTPHRPWIDNVVIRNPKTGNRMTRVPDVGNPWLDAGVVAFSTMKWNEDRDYWRQWYPADFITESFPGQFRNWFYALLAMSTLLGEGEPPFKTLLGFATVRDQFGKEMHKSEGNSIEFVGAADDGYELFRDIDASKDAALALKELPKNSQAVREELVTLKGVQKKRVLAKYKPIGADVIRWLYCRTNPASNLNFGPEPTDEVRAKFVLKLWNTYGFFVNYAIADGYDPASPPVPMSDRQAIDRWILSDLQALVTTARQSFEAYDLMTFALATESFIDDKLSNWYVRRNRPRFHSKTADLDSAGKQDKLAAYQTLHAVLRTVAQLIAPCVPFLSEMMWKNLGSGAASVHLTDYPVADATLSDPQLSTDMNAVMRIVSLGGAARNLAKQKVRQPLAEIRIKGNDSIRRTVALHAEIIADDLNIKQVTFTEERFARIRLKGKRKEVSTVYSAKGAKIASAIDEYLPSAEQEPELMKGALLNIIVDGEQYSITPSMWDHYYQSLTPGWYCAVDPGISIEVNGELTDALKLEGLARDVIRLVQDARKSAGLELLDKIALFLSADGDLGRAIEAHRATISTATQATSWLDTPPSGGHAEGRDVEKQSLKIALRKM